MRSLGSTVEGRENELVLALAYRPVQAFGGWVSEGWSSSASIGHN